MPTSRWVHLMTFAAVVSIAVMGWITLKHGDGPRVSTAEAQRLNAQYRRAAISANAPTGGPAPKALAVFVGDSYVGGAAGVDPQHTFAAQTCAVLKWRCRMLGYGGTGYVAGQDGGVDYTSRLPAAENPDVKFVVVVGGRNDIGKDYTAEEKRYAVRLFMADVGTQYPAAKVIVLEPFWVNSSPSGELVRLRKLVRESALQVRATWIPTDGWLNAGLISGDGVHPTADGHRKLGDKLAKVLKAQPGLKLAG